MYHSCSEKVFGILMLSTLDSVLDSQWELLCVNSVHFFLEFSHMSFFYVHVIYFLSYSDSHIVIIFYNDVQEAQSVLFSKLLNDLYCDPHSFTMMCRRHSQCCFLNC